MEIFLALRGLRSRPFEDFEIGAQHALFADALADGGLRRCRQPSRILAHDWLAPGLAKRLFLRYYRDFKATSRADGKLWTL